MITMSSSSKSTATSDGPSTSGPGSRSAQARRPSQRVLVPAVSARFGSIESEHHRHRLRQYLQHRIRIPLELQSLEAEALNPDDVFKMAYQDSFVTNDTWKLWEKFQPDQTVFDEIRGSGRLDDIKLFADQLPSVTVNESRVDLEAFDVSVPDVTDKSKPIPPCPTMKDLINDCPFILPTYLKLNSPNTRDIEAETRHFLTSAFDITSLMKTMRPIDIDWSKKPFPELPKKSPSFLSPYHVKMFESMMEKFNPPNLELTLNPVEEISLEEVIEDGRARMLEKAQEYVKLECFLHDLLDNIIDNVVEPKNDQRPGDVIRTKPIPKPRTIFPKVSKEDVRPKSPQEDATSLNWIGNKNVVSLPPPPILFQPVGDMGDEVNDLQERSKENDVQARLLRNTLSEMLDFQPLMTFRPKEKTFVTPSTPQGLKRQNTESSTRTLTPELKNRLVQKMSKFNKGPPTPAKPKEASPVLATLKHPVNPQPQPDQRQLSQRGGFKPEKKLRISNKIVPLTPLMPFIRTEPKIGKK